MYRRSLDLVRATGARTLRLCAGMTKAQSDYSAGLGKCSAGKVLDHQLLFEKLHRDIYARLIQIPMLEIPFTMLNLFVPTRVREAVVQFRFPPARNPDAAGWRRQAQIEEILRSRRFPKVA
jgi:hypothetical protein